MMSNTPFTRHLWLKVLSLLLVVVSFLMAQGASAHIHLSSQHNHHGSHHQHKSIAHTHQLANHHNDLIDSAQQAATHQIVELEQDCHHHSNNKLDEQPQLLLPTPRITQGSSNALHPLLPLTISHQGGWLSQRIEHPRAPPHRYV